MQLTPTKYEVVVYTGRAGGSNPPEDMVALCSFACFSWSLFGLFFSRANDDRPAQGQPSDVFLFSCAAVQEMTRTTQSPRGAMQLTPTKYKVVVYTGGAGGSNPPEDMVALCSFAYFSW
jgi:hypothetical protein